MPKRQSDEGRIVVFFTEAPLDSAKTLFNVVKGIMDRRTPKAEIKRLVTNKIKQKAEQIKAALAAGTADADQGPEHPES